MQMSDADIVKEYREAKNKGEHVKILADQNLCSVKTIIDILVAGGISPQQLPRVRQEGSEKKESFVLHEKADAGEVPAATAKDVKKPLYEKPVVEISAMTAPSPNIISEPPERKRTLSAAEINEEEIVLQGLCALRAKTENDMALAEAEYNARMKRYMDLLCQVDEIIKKREGARE